MHSKNTPVWHEEPSVEAREKQQDFKRVIAMSAKRRQASQAGKLWTVYTQTAAKNCMSFAQFKKPGQRNKILTGYGLEKIVTEFDPVQGNKRKAKAVTKH